jgi:predicted secreted hydrolase
MFPAAHPPVPPLLLLILSLAGVACSGTDPQGCPTPPDTDIALPADEAPHGMVMEWWYYTGHLTAAGNQRYGFELTIFQTRAGGQYAYVGHFAITDLQTQTHLYAQRAVAPPDRYSRFDLAIGDWTILGTAEGDRLTAAMDGYALDLLVAPAKPPAFHGERGIVEMGSGGTSFYYSKTRLEASGTLTVGGQAQEVTGLAWMDHQWGDFEVFGSDGWDWFSVQLDDDHDLMLYLLHLKDGSVVPTGGTLVTPEGCQRALSGFTATATGEWLSPRSGASYPMGWTLEVPAEEIQLTVTPQLLDQEMDCRQTTMNVYWEGAVSIQGTHHGRAVAGQGYVELCGYGPWGPGT